MHRTVIVALSLVLVAAPAWAAPGDADTTFAPPDGYVEIDFGGSDAARDGVLVGSKIVAVGGSDNGADFAVARLRPNGAPDATFHGDGKAITDFGGDDEGWGAAAYPRGKVVVVGYSMRPSGKSVFAVARYRKNGTLDRSFHRDGKALVPFPRSAYAYVVEVLGDGSMIVAGEIYDPGNTYGAFAMTKLLPDGRRDKTFGKRGIVQTNFGPGHDGAYGIDVLRDGRIALAGWGLGSGPTQWDTAVAIYHPNGKLDRSFGRRGKKVLDLEPGQFDIAIGVHALRDGRLVLGVNLPDAFGVVRLKPRGGLDRAFGGGDGIGEAPIPGGSPQDLVRLGKRYVVVGHAGGQVKLARFGPGGGLDASFGTDGVATPYPGDANRAVIQNGRILTFGEANTNFLVGRVLG